MCLIAFKEQMSEEFKLEFMGSVIGCVERNINQVNEMLKLMPNALKDRVR